VTLSGVESAPVQIETIAALVGSAREREWAVKDSFRSLELNSLGFEPLFDAECSHEFATARRVTPPRNIVRPE
jgi:hypothetical protein